MNGHKKPVQKYKDILLEIKNSSQDFKREYVEVEVVYLESQDDGAFTTSPASINGVKHVEGRSPAS